MTYPHPIIACQALAPVFEQLLGTAEPLTILEIALHLHPERLRAAIGETVRRLEQQADTIIMGYGLCGRSLEGVVSQKSTLVVPRVDDCVGLLLGSRVRHQQLLRENPGTYFMESRWLDTELNIFSHIDRGMSKIPQDRRRQLLKAALQHYNRLVLLTGEGEPDGEAAQRCRRLAGDYDLAFEQIAKELGLIDRLLHGPWDQPDFIVVPPGTSIPMF